MVPNRLWIRSIPNRSPNGQRKLHGFLQQLEHSSQRRILFAVSDCEPRTKIGSTLLGRCRCRNADPQPRNEPITDGITRRRGVSSRWNALHDGGILGNLCLHCFRGRQCRSSHLSVRMLHLIRPTQTFSFCISKADRIT